MSVSIFYKHFVTTLNAKKGRHTFFELSRHNGNNLVTLQDQYHGTLSDLGYVAPALIILTISCVEFFKIFPDIFSYVTTFVGDTRMGMSYRFPT